MEDLVYPLLELPSGPERSFSIALSTVVMAPVHAGPK
jgi:hypothetical protein